VIDIGARIKHLRQIKRAGAGRPGRARGPHQRAPSPRSSATSPPPPSRTSSRSSPPSTKHPPPSSPTSTRKRCSSGRATPSLRRSPDTRRSTRCCPRAATAPSSPTAPRSPRGRRRPRSLRRKGRTTSTSRRAAGPSARADLLRGPQGGEPLLRGGAGVRILETRGRRSSTSSGCARAGDKVRAAPDAGGRPGHPPGHGELEEDHGRPIPVRGRTAEAPEREDCASRPSLAQVSLRQWNDYRWQLTHRHHLRRRLAGLCRIPRRKRSASPRDGHVPARPLPLLPLAHPVRRPRRSESRASRSPPKRSISAPKPARTTRREEKDMPVPGSPTGTRTACLMSSPTSVRCIARHCTRSGLDAGARRRRPSSSCRRCSPTSGATGDPRRDRLGAETR